MVVLMQNITFWEISPPFISWNPDNASFLRYFMVRKSCSQMAVFFSYIVQIIYNFVFKSRKAQVDNIMVNCFSHVRILHSLNKEIKKVDLIHYLSPTSYVLSSSCSPIQTSVTYLLAAVLLICHVTKTKFFTLIDFCCPCLWTCLK